MPYSELVKNFARTRGYMREFYVWGFKHRLEYTRQSARSYDDERRRVESWLGDHVGSGRTAEGKNVFLSIDSRALCQNPLYRAWKTCSFTDVDITLHFILLDILHDSAVACSAQQLTACIDRDYLAGFAHARLVDESTVRKKLKEYVALGLLQTEKSGRQVLYRRAAACLPADRPGADTVCALPANGVGARVGTASANAAAGGISAPAALPRAGAASNVRTDAPAGAAVSAVGATAVPVWSAAAGAAADDAVFDSMAARTGDAAAFADDTAVSGTLPPPPTASVGTAALPVPLADAPAPGYAAVSAALDFFAEAAPCGVLGSFILDRLPAHRGCFGFKHHYITPALDAGILCALFAAMQEGREAEICEQSRRAARPCTLQVLPLRIYISVQSGRQYLLAWICRQARLCSLRLDYLLSVRLLSPSAQFAARRQWLQAEAAHMWGVSTRGRGCEAVTFTVRFAAHETHIPQRLRREKRCGTVEQPDEQHCRFSCRVNDAGELLPWVRSFIGRITALHFSNRGLQARFLSDLQAMYAQYGLQQPEPPAGLPLSPLAAAAPADVAAAALTPAGTPPFSDTLASPSADALSAAAALSGGNAAPVPSLPAASPSCCGPAAENVGSPPQTDFFHEVHSAYYGTVARLLAAAVRGQLTPQRMRSLIHDHAFAESAAPIETALRSQRWPLLHADSSTPLRHVPTLPLTTLEKRWLKALTLDKRLQLFDLPADWLADVQPLFGPQDYCLFDQYADGDAYDDPGYIARFRRILRAVQTGSPLLVTLESRGGRARQLCILPQRLEYSAKDDRFRLLCGVRGGSMTFNLANITAADPAEGQPLSAAPPPTADCSVTLRVASGRNAPERVMLHFSHFEKRVERADGGHFLVHLRYAAADETELLIRVLSFGPLVQVTQPARFARLLCGRLRDQLACGLPAR